MSSDSQLKIRPLTSADLKDLVALMDKVHKHSDFPVGSEWQPHQLQQELSVAKGLGAWQDKALAGFVLYRQWPKVSEITLLATSPEHQRQGVMRLLLKHIISQVGPGEQVWLEAHSDNLPAQHLYASLGFKRTGERPKYYRDGGDAVLFAYR